MALRLRHLGYLWTSAVGLYLAASLFTPLCTYKQDQAERVVVTTGGKPTKRDNSPGLAGIIPIYEHANKFTTKLVDYNSIPQDALTADKKTIQIDFYAMFRIADPQLFLQTVRPATLEGVHPIIDDVIYSEMRNIISQEYLLKDPSPERKDILARGDEIQERVRQIAAPILRERVGVDIHDIRLTITNPTENVREAVYTRMSAERAQKAQRDRSEGEKRSIEIRAGADRKVTELLSGAYRDAQKIKGEGDADSLRIIQDTYAKDPDLAFFIRELELLEQTATSGDTLIISTNSDLFDLMKNSK